MTVVDVNNNQSVLYLNIYFKIIIAITTQRKTKCSYEVDGLYIHGSGYTDHKFPAGKFIINFERSYWVENAKSNVSSDDGRKPCPVCVVVDDRKSEPERVGVLTTTFVSYDVASSCQEGYLWLLDVIGLWCMFIYGDQKCNWSLLK